MNLPKSTQQLNAIYALSHQELFELAKLMAFKATWMCQMLQGNIPSETPRESDIVEAIEFAFSCIPEAIAEARQGWKPTTPRKMES